jgi:hypothetical protein
MKLRLAELETARQNPRAWVRAAEGGQAIYGPSKTRFQQYAFYKYHEFNNDVERAIGYFKNLHERRFKTRVRFEILVEEIREYDRAYQALEDAGFTVVKTKLNVAIPVAPDLMLTGEIARIDLSPTRGYSVWLVRRESTPWQGELRMPLLQAEIARSMGVGDNLVSVGIYAYESMVFSPEQIDAASNEIQAIAAEIAAAG